MRKLNDVSLMGGYVSAYPIFDFSSGGRQANKQEIYSQKIGNFVNTTLQNRQQNDVAVAILKVTDGAFAFRCFFNEFTVFTSWRQGLKTVFSANYVSDDYILKVLGGNVGIFNLAPGAWKKMWEREQLLFFVIHKDVGFQIKPSKQADSRLFMASPSKSKFSPAKIAAGATGLAAAAAGIALTYNKFNNNKSKVVAGNQSQAVPGSQSKAVPVKSEKSSWGLWRRSDASQGSAPQVAPVPQKEPQSGWRFWKQSGLSQDSASQVASTTPQEEPISPPEGPSRFDRAKDFIQQAASGVIEYIGNEGSQFVPGWLPGSPNNGHQSQMRDGDSSFPVIPDSGQGNFSAEGEDVPSGQNLPEERVVLDDEQAYYEQNFPGEEFASQPQLASSMGYQRQMRDGDGAFQLIPDDEPATFPGMENVSFGPHLPAERFEPQPKAASMGYQRQMRDGDGAFQLIPDDEPANFPGMENVSFGPHLPAERFEPQPQPVLPMGSQRQMGDGDGAFQLIPDDELANFPGREDVPYGPYLPAERFEPQPQPVLPMGSQGQRGAGEGSFPIVSAHRQKSSVRIGKAFHGANPVPKGAVKRYSSARKFVTSAI
jgi:hypothetical protein